MDIAIEQSLATLVDTPVTSATSDSWSPGSNELLLCYIAARGGSTPAAYTTGVTGNGLTWEKIQEQDDTQNNVTGSVWRAMGASPSSGGVTVAFSTNPISMSFQLIRLSGVATGGTNGSGAIGAVASAETGATDTATPSAVITTTAANSRLLGLGTGRGQAWTEGSGFTPILLNQIADTGGDTVRSHSEYKDVAGSGAETTVDFSIASANEIGRAHV